MSLAPKTKTQGMQIAGVRMRQKTGHFAEFTDPASLHLKRKSGCTGDLSSSRLGEALV